MPIPRLLTTTAATLLLATPGLRSLNAATYDAQWQYGGGSSDWSISDNWSGNQVPNNTETDSWNVTLGDFSPYVFLDIDVTVSHFDFSSGVLDGDGTRTLTASTIDIGDAWINGSLNLHSGETRIGSATYPYGVLTVDFSSELNHSGVLIHSATYDEDTYETTQGYLFVDGIFRNRGNYQFATNIDGLNAIVMGAGSFYNENILEKTGAGTAEMLYLSSFVNTAQVIVADGILDIGASTGSEAHTGSFAIAEGSTLRFSEPVDGSIVTFETGGAVYGPGTLEVSTYSGVEFTAGTSADVGTMVISNDGTVSFAGDTAFEADHLEIETGTLNLEIDAIVGTADFQTAAINGSGSIETRGPTTVRDLTVTDATVVFSADLASGGTVLADTITENIASLQIRGAEVINTKMFVQQTYEDNVASAVVFSTEGSAENRDSSFRNIATAVYRIDGAGDSEITRNSPADAYSTRFINEGLFLKNGTGSTYIGDGVEFLNSGTLAIGDGTLHFAGSLSNTGTIILFGGTLLQEFEAGTNLAGRLTANSRTTIEGVATAGIAEGTTLSDTAIAISFAETADGETFSLGHRRASDIFRLAYSGDDFTFALEMTLDFEVSDDLYLGWLDSDNLWVNATEGYAGDHAGFYGMSYADFRTTHTGSLDLYLGAWGGAGGETWAILDHGGEFAVVAIPEPGTWAMALSGLGALLWMNRRRKRLPARP